MTLAGRGVVITRPAGQSDNLARLVREAGGEPMAYPAIVIEDIDDTKPLDAQIDRLDDFDLAIFVSPSAVERAMARILPRRTFPQALRCAAIGAGGAGALERHGVMQVVKPTPNDGRADSEALLATPFLSDVQNKRVLIFRGEGGRELLSDMLRARGALVEYAVCYRRGKPAFDPAPLLADLCAGRVHAVIATSSEGLRNFHAYLGEIGAARMRNTSLLVSHPRIAKAAYALGLTRVIESASGDSALTAALVRHFCDAP